MPRRRSRSTRTPTASSASRRWPPTSAGGCRPTGGRARAPVGRARGPRRRPARPGAPRPAPRTRRCARSTGSSARPARLATERARLEAMPVADLVDPGGAGRRRPRRGRRRRKQAGGAIPSVSTGRSPRRRWSHDVRSGSRRRCRRRLPTGSTDHRNRVCRGSRPSGRPTRQGGLLVEALAATGDLVPIAASTGRTSRAIARAVDAAHGAAIGEAAVADRRIERPRGPDRAAGRARGGGRRAARARRPVQAARPRAPPGPDRGVPPGGGAGQRSRPPAASISRSCRAAATGSRWSTTSSSSSTPGTARSGGA